MKIAFLFFLILPFNCHATWFCKEASSSAQGNTFYACGHAVAGSLSEAREKSLDAAKREFHAFCNESDNCRDYAYNITPMRTDCGLSNGKHSCYRGLEYTILKEKKSSKYVSKLDIKNLLEEKERELDDIHQDIKNLEKLNHLNNQAEVFNQADKKEVEYEYLKNHVSKDYNLTAKPSAFSFLISGSGLPLKDKQLPQSKDVFLVSIGGEFNQIIWRNLSIRLQVSLMGSLDENEKEKRNKTHNQLMYHSYAGTDFNLGLPIQFDLIYITPQIGLNSIKYKSTINSITQSGAINTQDKDLKYSSAYLGVGMRFGAKFFLDLSPKYYLENKKINGSFSIGINFGY